MESERREHRRFPIAEGLTEPISIEFDSQTNGHAPHAVPAVLTNLSAGGMSLVLFIEPPHTREIQLSLQLPGLKSCSMTARILRVQSKGDVYCVGLAFIKISKKDRHTINQLALDFGDCETRIQLGLPEACVPTCCYHALCSKPQKAPHWPPKA
jgi:c-di-GMP-binding flagellar brake protein YcgR